MVGQAVDGEVLSELSIGEIVSTKPALPIVIGVYLIDEHGPVLAAVPSQVPLPVAVDVEPTYQMAVWSVFPRHAISRGRPTLTESKRAVIFSSSPTIANGFAQSIHSTK